jgi:hypothetical protein
MTKQEQDRLLHDTFVRGNCHIGFWTHIEHFEFGTPPEPIKKFFKRIERIDERSRMCRALLSEPVYIKLAHPN